MPRRPALAAAALPLLAALAVAPALPPTAQASEKPKVYVLTDIGGDPDDRQSLVRLLSCANEFEIVGLSAGLGKGHTSTARPDLLREYINAYASTLDRLRLHASGFPAAEALRAVVKKDIDSNPHAFGAGYDTEASEHIISVIDRSAEPVWFMLWGGPRALAQAVWKVRNTRSPGALAAFKGKIRVYDIAGQDATASWMQGSHGDIFYLFSASNGGAFRGMYSADGSTQLLTKAWVQANVSRNHGALGAKYPNGTVGGPYGWGSNQGIKEGDTPSFLHVLPTGLSDPMKPEWGGWGGRFKPDGGRNFVDASDTWNGRTNPRVTVARWRAAYQREFEARMDWHVQGAAAANHPPVAAFRNDASLRTIFVEARPGQRVRLDASGSTDGDGDALSYRWMHYREPSGHAGTVTIANATSRAASVTVPAAASGKSIHVVLAVTDKGRPPLTRYRRIVINPTAADRDGLFYGSLELPAQ